MTTYKLIIVQVHKITVVCKAPTIEDAKRSWSNGGLINDRVLETEVLDIREIPYP